MHSSRHKWRRKGPFMLIFVLGFGAILSLIVMFLWNEVLVPVANVNKVSFWQAAGLLLLSRILLGGFKGGPWRGGKSHRGGGSFWREKWKNMSEEEREKFKKRWKERC